MSLRPPQNAYSRFQAAEAKSPLDSEIAQEKAAALGRAGRAMARAVAAFNAARAEDETTAEDLAEARQEAVEAVYAYFVQRELIGVRDHREIIRDHAIPHEVLARLGSKPKAI